MVCDSVTVLLGGRAHLRNTYTWKNIHIFLCECWLEKKEIAMSGYMLDPTIICMTTPQFNAFDIKNMFGSCCWNVAFSDLGNITAICR